MYVACDWDETPARCRNIELAIASPLAILGFANSLTNPVIYAWWHNGFRESAKAIFCGAACRKKRPTDSEGPSLSTGMSSASSGGGGGARGRTRTRGQSSEASSVGQEIGGANGTTVQKNGDANNKGREAFALSTDTLNVSAATDDVDLSDGEEGSVSDVENALRYRVVEAATPTASIIATGKGAANVCYEPNAISL